MEKKPTVDQVLELYDATKKIYDESGIWGQWEEDSKMYELEFANELNLPKEFENEGIILPTARDLVDTCTDNSDVYNPRVWVGRKGESSKSEEEKNLLRKFGLGVLHRNNIESSISPVRTGAKHYWMHGLTIIKTVWDADKYVNKPEPKDGESEIDYATRIDQWRSESSDSMPIVIQAVNPKNMMFDPYHEGGTFAFETREELCYNVSQRYPNWNNPKGKKVSEKVERISFWSPKYRCELYDREPVMKAGNGVANHKYGFIPYVQIETGLGNIDNDNDLKKRYVGVLRYVKGLLISESRDYSIGDVILKRTAFPWGYLSGPGAEGVKAIFQKFGEYNALPDGVEIHDMAPKVPPDALLTWLTVAANYLSAHAAPRSVQGLSEEGVRSGADRRLIIAQATARYQYSNEAFKHGIAKVLSNCARIMKNVVPGNINVWARTPTDEFDIEIKKDRMKEPFTFYVEFAPISEEDEYRRHDDLERLFKSGIVTKPWARKQMSNVDPEAMEIEEEVELLKQDPMIQQVISQYMAGKFMEALAKRQQAETLENPLENIPNMGTSVPNMGTAGQPQQGPGRRMVPPIRTPAPPGSAQEAQNALANVRSKKSMTQQGTGGGGNR